MDPATTTKEPEMELFVIVVLLSGLLVLDVLALTFGVDSRETIQDDWAR